MNIYEQKAIADELLERLEIICPHVILAGGAPRDWYFGKEANDLDIYYSLNPQNSEAADNFQLSKVLPEEMTQTKMGFEHTNMDPMYNHMEALRRISYYEYKGMNIQLIRLHKKRDVYQALSNMSCSICRVWYKNGEIHLTQDFKKTINSGVMWLKEGYNWRDYHPSKMFERFRFEYSTGTEEKADKVILRKVLKGGVK